MTRGYNGKMMRKQILAAREHSRKELPEREKTETSEQTITFNITYYPVFQKIRNILQELHLLLAPDKEHKRVFPNEPVVGFCNGKSLNPLSANPTKWSNILIQFVGNLPTNCLRVFDNFINLALKGLKIT